MKGGGEERGGRDHGIVYGKKSCCYRPGFCLLFWKDTRKNVHELLVSAVIGKGLKSNQRGQGDRLASGGSAWMASTGMLQTCFPGALRSRFRRDLRLEASGAGMLTQRRRTSAATACLWWLQHNTTAVSRSATFVYDPRSSW